MVSVATTVRLVETVYTTISTQTNKRAALENLTSVSIPIIQNLFGVLKLDNSLKVPLLQEDIWESVVFRLHVQHAAITRLRMDTTGHILVAVFQIYLVVQTELKCDVTRPVKYFHQCQKLQNNTE